MNLKSKRKLTKKVNDWLYFYYNVCSFAGKEIPNWEGDQKGLSPIECLFNWESKGKIHKCNDSKTLTLWLTAKAAVDMQIKSWALGVAEGNTFPIELIEEQKNLNFASWILKAALSQSKKIYNKSEIYQEDKKHFYKAVVNNYTNKT